MEEKPFPTSYRGCFAAEKTERGQRLVCQLCKADAVAEPVTFADFASGSKLKAHVERDHAHTAAHVERDHAHTAAAIEGKNTPTLKKPRQNGTAQPSDLFQLMMGAAKSHTNEDWSRIHPTKASFTRLPGSNFLTLVAPR